MGTSYPCSIPGPAMAVLLAEGMRWRVALFLAENDLRMKHRCGTSGP